MKINRFFTCTRPRSKVYLTLPILSKTTARQLKLGILHSVPRSLNLKVCNPQVDQQTKKFVDCDSTPKRMIGNQQARAFWIPGWSRSPHDMCPRGCRRESYTTRWRLRSQKVSYNCQSKRHVGNARFGNACEASLR